MLEIAGWTEKQKYDRFHPTCCWQLSKNPRSDLKEAGLNLGIGRVDEENFSINPEGVREMRLGLQEESGNV
jgi:hypothetical protein